MQSIFTEYKWGKGYGNKSLEQTAFIVTKPMRTISFISPPADNGDRPRMPDERGDPRRVD